MGRKKKKKFRVPGFVMDLGGHLTAVGVGAYMRSLDYRAAFYDRSIDPALGFDCPRIYVFWHENILIPLYLRGHCNLAMLLSQHGDADILARVARNFGFDCVRGSTYKGAARAIWELTERSKRQHLTITPDGPRGPRRQMALGPIYLASRLQMPLVVMGFGYDRPWRINSWDRFALPRPFSRARAILGPPMMLPPALDRDGLEHCRLRAERLLNCLTVEAEAWAAAGTSKAGEITIAPQRAPVLRAVPAEVPLRETSFAPSRAA
jgi:lysophospholipid acyltransferase (LPLAT)-like uncharacterized protein